MRIRVKTVYGPSFFLLMAASIMAQVHYHDDGQPWKQKAHKGPDSVVDGWYYNLGITGIRVQLMPDEPKHLLVKYVFKKSPASRAVKPGDVIIGVEGHRFETKHKNGYGMDKFGPDGPILEFANALEAAQDKHRNGWFGIEVRRGKKTFEKRIKIGTRYGTFSPTYPVHCEKTDLILKECLAYLTKHQRDDGSWGSPPQDTFAPLAFLAAGDGRSMKLVEKNVRMHARTTSDRDHSWLINWRYMAAGIVMSEYYLKTGKKWVLPELREVYRFLISSQYTDMSQIDPKTRKDRPRDLPRTKMQKHGGWGHNPGFEGYGPIGMLTAQGALVFSLLKRCGLPVDRKRHEAAYAFLARGTGKNGYMWYADEVSDDNKWADMGRTGAVGIANFLSPYPDPIYRRRALASARIIGLHPQSFPDTHGSPIMGMGYAAMAAAIDPASFRKLMDANKWWFVLAQCRDGSFYYQPNRDNAGYGDDSRIAATAVTAFILSIGKKNLAVTGMPVKQRGAR